jgi:phospholipase/lecithinase/hemolysin
MICIGLEETREACCGLGPLRATVGCVSKEMACATPERHVWWDLYSPTEAADALLANWSWTSSSDSGAAAGATSICGPISLQQLAGTSSPPVEV